MPCPSNTIPTATGVLAETARTAVSTITSSGTAAAWPHPDHLYSTVGDLDQLLGRLAELMRLIAVRLNTFATDPDITTTRRDSPAAQVATDAAFAVHRAALHGEAQLLALREAHILLSTLGTDPTTT